MARLGRYFLPDQPLHVIQRGNNRQKIFFAEDDFALYRDWLAEAAQANGCAIHAYVLMTNHVHLLVTPGDADSLPRTMQSLGRRYVRAINARRRRQETERGPAKLKTIIKRMMELRISKFLNPIRYSVYFWHLLHL